MDKPWFIQGKSIWIHYSNHNFIDPPRFKYKYTKSSFQIFKNKFDKLIDKIWNMWLTNIFILNLKNFNKINSF